jgi:hypothetical protein
MRSPPSGRRRSSYPEPKDCSFVFLPRATGCRVQVPGRAGWEAPASIPTQRGRATRFAAPSASVPAGSLTGLPFRTPLRHGEVDKGRDSPCLPESRGCPGIVGRLSPLLRRRPPPSLRSGPPAGVDRTEPASSPPAIAPNLWAPQNHASAGFASGYDVSMCEVCGHETHADERLPRPVPTMSRCASTRVWTRVSCRRPASGIHSVRPQPRR